MSKLTKAVIIALFGHDLDDEQMMKQCSERKPNRQISIYHKIKGALILINRIWNSKKLLNKCRQKYKNFDLLKGKTFSNAEEMFSHLQYSISETFEVNIFEAKFMPNKKYIFQPYDTHLSISQASAIYNLMILNMLSNNNG
jgi:hypothetical protein